MTEDEMIEVRAFRVEQMARQLGLDPVPGSDLAERLLDRELLKSCCRCSDAAKCRSFTSSEDRSDLAPDFCVNQLSFEALIAEFGAKDDVSPASPYGIAGWMSGSSLAASRPAGGDDAAIEPLASSACCAASEEIPG